MRFALLAVLAVVLGGCVSQTMISSRPSGALVRSLRSGAEICDKTPCAYEDSATNGNTEGFAVELDGYRPKTIQIRRDQINGGRVAGFLIPGVILWPVLIGLLWSSDYRPDYAVTLEPISGAKEEAPR